MRFAMNDFMITHYLKVALRRLKRERGYAALNLLSLTIGIAGCLFISLYIADERRYDRHHVDADRAVRVVTDILPPDAPPDLWAVTPPP